MFKSIQAERLAENEEYRPLNIACVFSPPPKIKNEEGGDKNTEKNEADVKQIKEDLEQEKKDNTENAEENAQALQRIIADYNAQYSTNHRIYEFDSYYKDIQKRIKDHKYPNADYAHKNKIDVTIVVDMLLTGFDAQYLNTLYVDKNLRFHGLIQALSRTNRTLNSTKKQGNILDFRGQQNEVNAAMLLFSGEKSVEAARQIWEVPPAAVSLREAAVKTFASSVKSWTRYTPESNATTVARSLPPRNTELKKSRAATCALLNALCTLRLRSMTSATVSGSLDS